MSMTTRSAASPSATPARSGATTTRRIVSASPARPRAPSSATQPASPTAPTRTACARRQVAPPAAAAAPAPPPRRPARRAGGQRRAAARRPAARQRAGREAQPDPEPSDVENDPDEHADQRREQAGNGGGDDYRADAGGDDGGTGGAGYAAHDAIPGRAPVDLAVPTGQPHAIVDHRESAVQQLPQGGHPNPKHFTVRQFDGRVLPGAFDAGVIPWCKQFRSQLIGAQLRDGHRWSDAVQCSILLTCLSDEATDVFNELWQATPGLTVDQGLASLTEKYSTKIGEAAIRDRIRQATRRTDESYESYAQRLLTMADALPGSRYVETNAIAALEAFISTASPAEVKQLKFFAATAAQNKAPALLTLSNAVNFLTLFDKSDGVKALAPAAKRAKNNRGAATSAPAPVMAVVADRKRKRTMRGMTADGVYIQPKNVTADTKCRACGQLGHISWDPKCPQFLAQNTPFKAAVGQAVEEDSA
ncbi:hypothetical protein PF005_g14084 [Phytophthora fragariae]|uniref:Retrotransposon gag domain-containing protein n=2 Tax=Phytophthora fragariae TaxID=53985 RepID=A0A6A3ESE7_9STRA|nr:hypothetical protein PF003_g39329 [Phytophthora fragariae]KAE8935453.1 hypothetical protein PF009_g14607 [Phytophthora fragariae]KAE9103484.1 hypothetical protein PF007_g14392 [Phytophthora fragariae]KAE9203679.1 hypothetical protein PF005_g14084 [Phytophthora fragariae]KAE9209287.1 hypothetical protein PF002_g19152 [Phytophthora fragariae]